MLLADGCSSVTRERRPTELRHRQPRQPTSPPASPATATAPAGSASPETLSPLLLMMDRCLGNHKVSGERPSSPEVSIPAAPRVVRAVRQDTAAASCSGNRANVLGRQGVLVAVIISVRLRGGTYMSLITYLLIFLVSLTPTPHPSTGLVAAGFSLTVERKLRPLTSRGWREGDKRRGMMEGSRVEGVGGASSLLLGNGSCSSVSHSNCGTGVWREEKEESGSQGRSTEAPLQNTGLKLAYIQAKLGLQSAVVGLEQRRTRVWGSWRGWLGLSSGPGNSGSRRGPRIPLKMDWHQ
ncbi:hypothetical protein EYF80_004016 [Liparis tanakae]|uniref:Uncharacterized protein n=1 Tax=Liparis tanakae TaxID=230148 RepID=A0A4Z2J6F2_9TELE|nr:hypothetical protein EYF80_004016 [Liparis tanakae]